MFGRSPTSQIYLPVIICISLSSSLWALDDLSTLPDPTRPDLGLKALNEKKTDASIGDQIGEVITTIEEEPVKALPPKLRLQYTLISPQRRLAVINGKVVEEGLTIAGAKIVEIRSEQVVARHEGKQLTLDLAHYQKKQTEPEPNSEHRTGEVNAASKDSDAVSTENIDITKAVIDASKDISDAEK